MPIPSPADFRNKSKKHSEVREMMAQMAESAESKDGATTKANAAKTEAIATAATDATTRANAAEENAEKYTDSKTSNVSQNLENDIHQFVDNEFSIVARIDEEAQLFLADLDESVQVEINKQKMAVTQAEAGATTKANAAEANAKLYTDQKTKNIDSNVDNDTHQFTDEDFNIVARIDSDAQLHLVDLENSVQVEINNQKKTATHTSDIESLLHVFADDDDNIVAGIDKSGGLQLVGSTVSLQEKLNWRVVQLPDRDFNERDLFADSVNKYILNMSVSGNQNSPIPFNLLPQKYTVPDSIVNEFTLAPPTNYIPLTTPYGENDKVVHPYIIEFSGNFRGYRYLMCITPYTQESHENPVIMGSNDLEKWEMLTGFDQPIATPLPGRFISDNGFAYNPMSGMLICYWRDGISNSSDDTSIFYRATRNGIEWTDAKLLIAADVTSAQLSPSVLFNPNDGLWHMWIGQESGYWRHYTAKNLNNSWTLKSTTPFLEKGIWHSEVKFVGDKYVMLINKRDPNSNFYFAISADGDNWTSGKYLFEIQQEALYKASFLPKFNSAGQLAFDIFYTTNHATNPDWLRKFFHLTTNYAGI